MAYQNTKRGLDGLGRWGVPEGKSPLVNWKCTISIFKSKRCRPDSGNFVVTSMFAARRRWAKPLPVSRSVSASMLSTPAPPPHCGRACCPVGMASWVWDVVLHYYPCLLACVKSFLRLLSTQCSVGEIVNFVIVTAGR